MKFVVSFITLVEALAMGGCYVEEGFLDDDVGVVYQPVDVDNSSLYNGTKYNGTKYNGTALNEVTLDGTTFSAVDSATEQPLTGSAFIGVDMQIELEGGGTGEVRITDIEDSGITGMEFFTVEYYNGSTWENLCESGTKAIPVHGKWNRTNGDFEDDGNHFTFACRGAAIAKCLEWGYVAWNTQEECDGGTCKDQSLHEFHLACINMVRADYCGDGISHTEDGTLIDAYDALGIMTDETGVTMDFEAEWGADGANCIKHTRWENGVSDLNEYNYIQTNCPSRWVGPSDTDCGSSTSTFHTSNGFNTSLSTRTLFHNESNNNYRY